MSQWPSTKAKRALSALLRLGWTIKRQSGSHRTLAREGWPDFVFAFHDGEELGPRMLARIARHIGPRPETRDARAASHALTTRTDQ
ncbi:YcfA family protein, partial [mine drainage metagenome]